MIRGSHYDEFEKTINRLIQLRSILGQEIPAAEDFQKQIEESVS